MMGNCRTALILAALILISSPRPATAQFWEDSSYKELPPVGIELERGIREQLANRAAGIRAELRFAAKSSDDSMTWFADVAVFVRAVELALDQRLFFKKSQLRDAEQLLDEAECRLKAVARGERGLRLLGFSEERREEPQMLVGGFVSRIDDSVQPFGIVLPAAFESNASPYRMDVWLHGRGDTKTEIPFIKERMTKPGLYTPSETVVLHPFGRHCNAFKFAGETDVYEAIDHVSGLVALDESRLAIRGFSMGGAGCWHLAVHDPTKWFAANPGAGFVDTVVYQGWKSQLPFELTPVRKKLLRLYDVLPWVSNLKNTRVVAYSGEIDKQKQAADRVVSAANGAGFKFPYVIGPKMGHKIDDDSKIVIDQTLARWADERVDGPSPSIDFITYTLRYSSADWFRVTGMGEHWRAARVKASVNTADTAIHVETENVTHLEIDFARWGWPKKKRPVDLKIDGQSYLVSDAGNRPGFQVSLARDAHDEWTLRKEDASVLRKRPGLQGPIDDAFCDRFVIVLPSRPAKHGRVQRWIDGEMEYLKRRWERLMRGKVNMVLDKDLTQEQIRTSHLICFGDFSSNRVLASVAASLPIDWSRESIRMGEQTFDAANHAAVFCYPNPLNPSRYLVANSGMTFREFSNNSNSRQIAMLPDWAIIDVTQVDRLIFPGGVVGEGFFNESWKIDD